VTTRVRDGFTGQARDAEIGLDYFQARYYGAAFGRFTSPDPGNAGADLTNPQTWNGYTYVMNSSLSATDPSGMLSWSHAHPPVEVCVESYGKITRVVPLFCYCYSGFCGSHRKSSLLPGQICPR